MTIFWRCDHIADHVDFLASKLLWRASWTRGSVVECTAFVTIPVVVACLGKTDRPQYGSDSDVGARPPDRGQQSLLVIAISDPDSVEGETCYSHNDDGQTQQRSELGDSTAKLNHFTLEPHGVEIKNIERYDIGNRLVKPAARS